MAERLVTKYVKHLRAKGYKVERNKGMYVVLWEFDSILMAFNVQINGLMLQNYYELSSYGLKNRVETLEFVNDLNASSNIVNFALDEKGMQMTYWMDAMHYDKERFDIVISLWEQDITDLLDEKNYLKYLFKVEEDDE